jgi:hypothetical protein
MILPQLSQVAPRRTAGPRDAAAGGAEEARRQRFTPASGLASAASNGVASGPGPVASVPLPEAPSLPVRTSSIVGPVFPEDRPILDSFAADISAAPEIIGELTALYIEQHCHLAIRFVSHALALRPDAAEDILAAARRREVYGIRWLAGLIVAAVALATAPDAAEAAPKLLDPMLDIIDFTDPLDDTVELARDFAPRPAAMVLSADDVLSDRDGMIFDQPPRALGPPTAPLSHLWETLVPLAGT